MANFWDNIGANNYNNNNMVNGTNNQNRMAQLINFIKANRGKTLDQMLQENGLNVSMEDIKQILPQAEELQKILNNFGIK